MSIEIVMPKIGLNMEEGMIVEWVKKEGDYVNRGDVLFVLEDDIKLDEKYLLYYDLRSFVNIDVDVHVLQFQKELLRLIK